MSNIRIGVVLLALPVYGLPWWWAPYATIFLILGFFLLGFIESEYQRGKHERIKRQ